MKNWIATCFALLAMMGLAAGQNTAALPRIPGELTVQLHPGFRIEAVAEHFTAQYGTAFTIGPAVVPEWGIYVLLFNESVFESTPSSLLEMARRHPAVSAAQWNCRVNDRDEEPDDPEWLRQNNLVHIGAPDAWVAGTGGITPAGDTIVIAVLEKGIFRNHPDLLPNLWYFYGEIPGDGIDNDGNGYTDDFRGYDALNGGDGDGSPSNNHGTVVAGIVGARGNNGTGISGVNWNTKLLTITNSSDVNSIIRAHRYVHRQRQLYNQTNRQKGAFIVALNASFGIDNAQASDFPVWCALYDSLGNVGVLSAAATANRNVDVDVAGDMPTTCPSEFLISVTNITELDVLNSGSGYGATAIDLGAPGYKIFALTSAPERYATTSTTGTSWATPHVSGSVGLLYSIPCATLSSDALTNPAATARRVRDLLYSTVIPSPSLEGKTTTGGRLNLGGAAAAVRNLCEGSVGVLALEKIAPSPGRGMVTVYYETPDFGAYTFRVFNMLGQLVFEDVLQPDQFSAKTYSFDTGVLASGMYIFAVGRGEVVSSKKFIKF